VAVYVVKLLNYVIVKKIPVDKTEPFVTSRIVESTLLCLPFHFTLLGSMVISIHPVQVLSHAVFAEQHLEGFYFTST
jgi:hypothetical protein